MTRCVSHAAPWYATTRSGWRSAATWVARVQPQGSSGTQAAAFTVVEACAALEAPAAAAVSRACPTVWRSCSAPAPGPAATR